MPPTKKNLSPKILKTITTVFLVDDHPIVRAGLAQLINQESGLCVCGEAEDAHEALQKIADLKPTIVVLDISMKGMNGVDLIKQLQERHPKLPLLVLSMHDEAIYAERALRAGAKGYVMKQEGTERLISAIRKVLKNEIAVSDDVTAKILNRLTQDPKHSGVNSIERLSDRELEVFRLIGQAIGTRQIAERLCLSIKTVETHREHIKQKLGILRSPQLVQQAVNWVRTHDQKI
jgi:DNA-binding NarL/FixJ family response regulator